jgi:chromate transporter
VVGVLAAALYNPIWTSAVRDPLDIAVIAAGFVLLVALRAPPLLWVVMGAAFGLARAGLA